MAIQVTINISEAGTTPVPGTAVQDHAAQTAREMAELKAQMGDHIGPFPPAGVDGFLSHFLITVQFTSGDQEGNVMSWTMPTAIQTVSRSDPFIYRNGHEVRLTLPPGCTLPDTIAETDFLERPNGYFEPGKETVWMQILNLDARMDTEVGPVRIILGETLKREYPDIFRPSLGVATSLGRKGFPARLFFNPVAVVETPFGALRAIHGTLAYGRIVAFPPTGTPVSIQNVIPMHSVDSVRAARAFTADTPDAIPDPPPARIIALAHPIDVAMQIPGDEAFQLVERRIRLASGRMD